MSRKHKKRKSAGTPPGSLVFTGNQKMESPRLLHITYDEREFTIDTPSNELLQLPADPKKHWLDLRGLHNEQLINQLGKSFGISPIVLEDVLNVNQRPMLEEYPNGLFFVLKAFTTEKETDSIRFSSQQIAIFCNNNITLSFHENPDDLFLPIRERIRTAQGKIREKSAGFLAYSLMDMIVDQYYLLTDRIEIALEKLEENITTNPGMEIKVQLHECRSNILSLRRDIKPLQEVIFQFQKSDSPFKEPDIQPLLRDLSGHISQIVESLDSDLELLSGLQDLYLSELSFQMNKIIQTLTIVSTIFIPLTFLTSLYGMNFRYMPGLLMEKGYFYFLGLIILLSVLMILYFKNKKWL